MSITKMLKTSQQTFLLKRRYIFFKLNYNITKQLPIVKWQRLGKLPYFLTNLYTTYRIRYLTNYAWNKRHPNNVFVKQNTKLEVSSETTSTTTIWLRTLKPRLSFTLFAFNLVMTVHFHQLNTNYRIYSSVLFRNKIKKVETLKRKWR